MCRYTYIPRIYARTIITRTQRYMMQNIEDVLGRGEQINRMWHAPP